MKTKNDNKWQLTRMGNLFLKGDGFYISYNDDAPGASDVETALCKNDKYFILNGDFREDYEKLISEGFDACKAFYDKHNNVQSNWSSKSKTGISADQAIAAIPGMLKNMINL